MNRYTPGNAKDFVSETLVMLLAGGEGERLYPLTRHRAKPAVPFGGIYRIIDFTLSNCLNSGLRRIAVLTQYRSYSLDRHIRTSWNVFNTELGESIDTIPPQQRFTKKWYQGTADAIYQNIYTLEQERPQYVLILSGDHVYKMNYRNLIEDHISKGADLTVACIEVPINAAGRFGVVHVDKHMAVVDFEEKPEAPEPISDRPGFAFCSMGVYIFNTDALVRSVINDAKQPGSHDFGKDIIPAMVGTHRVYAHKMLPVSEDGRPPYWRDIGTFEAYWEANMDLVGASPDFDLHDSKWPVRSQLRQLAPAKIVQEPGCGSTHRAEIIDSLISPSCIISGGKIERSVLSPGVRVGPGSHISDSIIFDGVRIGQGVRINRTIMDKNVIVPDGTQIGVNTVSDSRTYAMSKTGIVVVPKEMPITSAV